MNLMCKAHKANNKRYRDNYSRIFTGASALLVNQVVMVKGSETRWVHDYEVADYEARGWHREAM